MSATYGYDLKDGDKILEAPVQTSDTLTTLTLPGAALVNDIPICVASYIIPAMLVVSHRYFQCGIFLHGYHTSATNQWRDVLGS